MCTCRGCYLLFSSNGRRRRALPGGRAIAASRSPSCAEPAQWDALQIPVSVAFFFVNSTHRPGVRLLPEPGGGDRVAAAARRLGRGGRRQPGARERWSPTSRRSSSAPAGAASSPSATSCRSTGATSWSARFASCGGASTAARRCARRSTRSSPRWPIGPAWRPRHERPGSLRGVEARAEPYAAQPTLMLRLRDHRDHRARPCTPSR